jgi:hypothetical protein
VAFGRSHLGECECGEHDAIPSLVSTVGPTGAASGEFQVFARATVETCICSAPVLRLRRRPWESLCFLPEHRSIGFAVILVLLDQLARQCLDG